MKHRILESSCVLVGASEWARPESTGGGVSRSSPGPLLVENGRIAAWGDEAESRALSTGVPRVDLGDRAVLPGLIDAHTHIVFGGDRTEDFARRARGLSYAEIAAAGGGILTTVEATRRTPSAELMARARRFLERRFEAGVLTTEIKSGYGLDPETEIRMLEVVKGLREEGWDVEGTLLAAHVVPKDRPREAWIRIIIEELIPEVAERALAGCVDVFVEAGAYSSEEARVIAEAAAAHGLAVRLHVDQLTPGGGAELAAEIGARSADHLERISTEGPAALARAEVVGGLLPGAMLHLGDSAPNLGRRLIDAGAEVFVATDANPGSSPTHNLALMATLAVTQLGLTAEEALRAVTLGAARALGRTDVGHLEVGGRARFVVLQGKDVRSWVAAFGEPTVAEVWTTKEDPVSRFRGRV